MTANETAELIARIVVAYPNADKYRDEASVKTTVALWADIFADDPKDLVTAAVTRHIATSKWPPSIAEIRDIMTSVSRPDIIAPHDAWLAIANARTALSEFSGDSEIRAALPAIVANVALSMGWSRVCRTSREEFHAEFMRLYRDAYDAARAEAATPTALRVQLSAMRDRADPVEHNKLARIASKAAEQQAFYLSLFDTSNVKRIDHLQAIEGSVDA